MTFNDVLKDPEVQRVVVEYEIRRRMELFNYSLNNHIRISEPDYESFINKMVEDATPKVIILTNDKNAKWGF